MLFHVGSLAFLRPAFAAEKKARVLFCFCRRVRHQVAGVLETLSLHCSPPPRTPLRLFFQLLNVMSCFKGKHPFVMHGLGGQGGAPICEGSLCVWCVVLVVCRPFNKHRNFVASLGSVSIGGEIKGGESSVLLFYCCYCYYLLLL